MGGADQEFVKRVEEDILDGLSQLQELEARIEAGEEIPAEELSVLMYELAGRIEDARARLEKRIGTISRDVLLEGIQSHLGDDGLQEWLETESDQKHFREQWDQERRLREQLVPGYQNPNREGSL